MFHNSKLHRIVAAALFIAWISFLSPNQQWQSTSALCYLDGNTSHFIFTHMWVYCGV